MRVDHPWQSGPTELLAYALQHLHKASEFDQRIAFLLLDIGVETVFKTFLQLPDEVTGTQVAYSKRREAAEGSFHDLIRGVQTAAASRVSGVNLAHVQFYHDLRNKLYHEGNGITIPSEKAKGYADLAITLLDRLLGVDLSTELYRTQREAEEDEQIAALENELATAIRGLEELLPLAIETIQPAFVLPSFEQALDQWRNQVFEFIRSRPASPDGHWVADDELTGYARSKAPASVNDFLTRYEVRPSVVQKMAWTDSAFVFHLIVADIALKLDTDPSDADYALAKLCLTEGGRQALGLRDFETTHEELNAGLSKIRRIFDCLLLKYDQSQARTDSASLFSIPNPSEADQT